MGDTGALAAILARLLANPEEVAAMKRAAGLHVQRYGVAQAANGVVRAALAVTKDTCPA